MEIWKLILFVTLAASFVLSFIKEETISEGSANWYVSEMQSG